MPSSSHGGYDLSVLLLYRRKRQARDHATLNGVELVEQKQLEALLREHHVTMLEVERMLHTDWAPLDEVAVELV